MEIELLPNANAPNAGLDAYDEISVDYYDDLSNVVDISSSSSYSTGLNKIVCTIPDKLVDVYKCNKITVGVYETPYSSKSRIRKAISGMLTPYRVGNRQDEDRFFVVNWATGHNGRQTPMKLFFDSPYELEKYLFVQVQDSIKDKWRQKQQKVEQIIQETHTNVNTIIH